MLLEMQTWAPSPCLGSQYLYPALCLECFCLFFPALLSPSHAAPSWPPWTAPGGACHSLERPVFPVMGPSALPILVWTGFGPSWGGHSLRLSLSAPGSHPIGAALLLTDFTDHGFSLRLLYLLREGRRDVLGESWESQQIHAGLLSSTHCSHSLLISSSQRGAVSREGTAPRECAPLVLLEGRLIRVCCSCTGLGISVLPAGFVGSHSTQGRRPCVPITFRALQSWDPCERSCQAASGGAAHTLQLTYQRLQFLIKVHCRKANAEAPGIGAQQLKLQTSCPAASGASQTPTASTAAEDGT